MNFWQTFQHWKGPLLASLLIGMSGCGRAQKPSTEKPRPDVSFKPQEVTDALHAVIAADRAVYARDIVQRLADEKVVRCSAEWKAEKALPLPSQMLQMATHEIQRGGAEFHYALRSLSPINPRNAPATAIEKAGLQFVLEHQDANFYSEESLGGRRYFTAVYADRATVPVCAECHNQHPASARKDFKTGDVLGGLIVRVPLEF
jgi:hypothetical protein